MKIASFFVFFIHRYLVLAQEQAHGGNMTSNEWIDNFIKYLMSETWKKRNRNSVFWYSELHYTLLSFFRYLINSICLWASLLGTHIHIHSRNGSGMWAPMHTRKPRIHCTWGLSIGKGVLSGLMDFASWLEKWHLLRIITHKMIVHREYKTLGEEPFLHLKALHPLAVRMLHSRRETS